MGRFLHYKGLNENAIKRLRLSAHLAMSADDAVDPVEMLTFL